jgi:hypothetical protein
MASRVHISRLGITLTQSVPAFATSTQPRASLAGGLHGPRDSSLQSCVEPKVQSCSSSNGFGAKDHWRIHQLLQRAHKPHERMMTHKKHSCAEKLATGDERFHIARAAVLAHKRWYGTPRRWPEGMCRFVRTVNLVTERFPLLFANSFFEW